MKESPELRTPESQGSAPSGRVTRLLSAAQPGSPVTVCGERPSLRHSTASPVRMRTSAGSKAKSGVMTTVTAGVTSGSPASATTGVASGWAGCWGFVAGNSPPVVGVPSPAPGVPAAEGCSRLVGAPETGASASGSAPTMGGGVPSGSGSGCGIGGGVQAGVACASWARTRFPSNAVPTRPPRLARKLRLPDATLATDPFLIVRSLSLLADDGWAKVSLGSGLSIFHAIWQKNQHQPRLVARCDVHGVVAPVRDQTASSTEFDCQVDRGGA